MPSVFELISDHSPKALRLITRANASKALACACVHTYEDAALVAISTVGCDINVIVQWYHNTPLFICIRGGMHKAALALIAAGADHNRFIKSPYIATPLTQACFMQWVEGVRALVDAGADVEYVPSDGKTARHIVERLRRDKADEMMAILDSAVELRPLK